MDPRTVPLPLDRLPLFAVGYVRVGNPPVQATTITTTHGGNGAPVYVKALAHGRAGRAKGMDGAEDAARHLKEHAPSWVLTALGDALMAFRKSSGFTFEQVRTRAEQSDAVKLWLGVSGRENCFPGWVRSRIRLHRLERTGADAIAERGDARGRRLPKWKFPHTGK